MVPRVGIEPTLSYPNQILSLARLPVSPPRQRSAHYSEKPENSKPVLVFLISNFYLMLDFDLFTIEPEGGGPCDRTGNDDQVDQRYHGCE